MHLHPERASVVDMVITRLVGSSPRVRPRSSGTTCGGTAVVFRAAAERSRKAQCTCGHGAGPSHEWLVAGERTCGVVASRQRWCGQHAVTPSRDDSD